MINILDDGRTISDVIFDDAAARARRLPAEALPFFLASIERHLDEFDPRLYFRLVDELGIVPMGRQALQEARAAMEGGTATDSTWAAANEAIGTIGMIRAAGLARQVAHHSHHSVQDCQACAG